MKKLCLLFVIVFCCNFVFLYGCENTGKTCRYQIDCELNGNVLTGRESFYYYNDTDTSVKELKFNLYGNAFRKEAKYKPVSPSFTAIAYPDGMSYGEIQINSVKENGKEKEFNICGEDCNILSVTLEKELFPSEHTTVYIDYTLTLANVIARTGINSDTINLSGFYPILCARDNNGFYECLYYDIGDPFYSDCADYKVSLTVDSKYVVACCGTLVSSKQKEDKTTFTYRIDKARSFCAVLSSSFKVLSGAFNGVEINYYYYKDEHPNENFDYIVRSLKTFSELFGGYIYPTYTVAQTKLIEGGMEFSSIVMISDGLKENETGEVIVHETAHQWWQTAVGNNEIEYGFLDEGLAEYSVVLFYENNPEYNVKKETLIKSAEQTYKVFCSVYDKLFGGADTVMIKSLSEFDGEYEYVNIAYIKGCLMFDYLRKTIGDERFFKGLKRYYKEYTYKNATPEDLTGIYEKTGADTNGFFNSFFNGKVII